MAVCQNLVPLVNIKIAGKWMFIPLKMVCIGIDPYPYGLWVNGIYKPRNETGGPNLEVGGPTGAGGSSQVSGTQISYESRTWSHEGY